MTCHIGGDRESGHSETRQWNVGDETKYEGLGFEKESDVQNASHTSDDKAHPGVYVYEIGAPVRRLVQGKGKRVWV